MKERTVRVKNFLGALLGGIMGILGFSFINHSAALPAGCLLGAFLGWCYQEVWEGISSKFKQSTAYLHVKIEKASAWMGKPREINIIRPLIVKIIKSISFPGKLARSIRKWTEEHPMNKALLLSCLASCLCFAAVISSVLYFKPEDAKGANNFFAQLIFLPILYSVAYAVAWAIFIRGGKEERVEDMRKFYEDFAYIATHGSLRFFFRELREILHKAIYFFVFAMVVIIYHVIVWPSTLVVAAAFSFFYGATKSFYQVSTKAGFWFCFGVTLGVTALSAWMTFPWLNNKLWVWIIALLTGLASAAATQALTSLAAEYLEAKPRIKQFISAPLSSYLAPIVRYYKETPALIKKAYGFIPASVRS